MTVKITCFMSAYRKPDVDHCPLNQFVLSTGKANQMSSKDNRLHHVMQVSKENCVHGSFQLRSVNNTCVTEDVTLDIL